MRRDETHSILLVYAADGFLPCTGVKKGYYKSEEFYSWINEDLPSHCNPYSEPRSIICLTKVSKHVSTRIEELVEAHSCLLWFLSLYSPDYNSIEFTFSILKA